MSLAARRLHERISEVVVWSGTAMTLTAFYFLFINNKAAAPEAPKLSLREALRYTESTVIELPSQPPPVSSAHAIPQPAQLK